MIPLYGSYSNVLNDTIYVKKELNKIRNNQWDYQVVKRKTNRKLKLITAYAIRNVPFYKKLYNNNKFKIIENIDKISLLPLLSKETIRKNFIDMCSNNIPSFRLYKRKTSGTTGIPITIVYDAEAVNYNWVILSRRLECLEYSLSNYHNDQTNFVMLSDHRSNNLWAGNIPIPKNPKMIRLSFYESQSSTEKIRFFNIIAKLKPSIIFGNPTSLLYLSRFLQSNHNITFFKPRLIMSSGIQLNKTARSIIENTLDTKVYNNYTVSEGGNIAGECIYQNGLHIESHRFIVESLKHSNFSSIKSGEIIITDLINHAMPIFRYRTGDSCIIDDTPCKCGVEYPRIQSIKGKKNYYFENDKGIKFSPLYLGLELHSLGYVHYQLIQYRSRELEFIYINHDRISKDNNLKNIIYKWFGNVNITIRKVRAFSTRKKKYNFISHIPDPYL